MPIIKSAKKRAKQALVRRDRNFNVRTALKKGIRNLTDSVKAGEKKAAEGFLQKAYKVIDMATKKKILHRNTAARRKSSLAKMVSNIKEGAAKEVKEVKTPKAKAAAKPKAKAKA